MPRLSRELAALPLSLLALACLCLGALAPAARRAAAQDNTPPPPAKEEPKVAVYGRAVYADGRPVRRARVTLVGVGGNRTDLGGLTDARGEFRIRGVRAGRYYAVLDVPGVMSPLPFISYGQSGGGAFAPGEVDKYFEVIEVDGRGGKEVTVRAHLGAAIGGKVTYAGGDPAPGVFVHVLRRGGGRLTQIASGSNVWASSSGSRTDDRGVYRVAGLPPGDYVLAVSEAESHGDDGRQSGGYAGEMYEGVLSGKLLTTYYPSVTSAKEATA